MTTMLSPLAHPFHPHNSMEPFQVFNDGIPSGLTPVGTDFIRGISDEAIDEHFPPTAQEVAELEAVEEFVRTLASLDALEEREERVRHDFSLLPKRWAVRRELHGKPRPARSQPEARNHRRNSEDDIKLVVYDRKQRNFSFERMEHHHSHRDAVRSRHQVVRANKMANPRRAPRPIQQPRKFF